MKKSIFVFLIFFTLFSSNCFRKPKWQTSVTIPLVSKFYSLQSFIDTNYIKINSDSSLQFFLSGELDTIVPIDSLHIQNRSDTLITRIFDFILNNLVKARIGVTPDEVTGTPFPDTTILTPIPAFDRNINKEIRINNVGSATLRSGILNITIINDSRLTFDSVQCRLPNCEVLMLDGIDSLSTTEYSKHLYNVSIESTASFNLFFSSHGTGLESIYISRHDSIKFIISFDSLRIEFGYFRSIPPHPVRAIKNRMLSIPTNYKLRIDDLIFGSGQLSMSLSNFFPLSTILQCSIPELDFDTTLNLTTQSSIDFTLNLENRQYHNESESLTPLTLRTVIEFQLDSFYIALGPDNSIIVSYLIDNIQIDSVAGTIIDTIKYSFQLDSIAINLPDFLKKTRATNVTGIVNITNAIAFPINLTLHASAQSINGNTSIDTTYLIQAGTPNNPCLTPIAINLTDLFNIHPNHISINIKASSVGSGWMSRASYCTASYIITSPLRVVLKADTLVFNPLPVKIGEKNRNLVSDYGDSSVFYVRFQNHLPIHLSGNIKLKNSVSDSVFITIFVPCGILDNNSGQVVLPSDSTITLSLNSKATQIFADSTINLSMTLYLPDTDTIAISGCDYFRIVNSYAQVHTKPILKEKNNQ